MDRQLLWHATAPGLLYEAHGASDRRYVVAANGDGAWTLDLLIDHTYETEQAADPQPAATLDEAKHMAQEWESELW